MRLEHHLVGGYVRYIITAAGCAVKVYLSNIFYIYIFVFTLRISYILKLLKYIVI